MAYFQSQICTAWGVATGSSYEAVPVHTAGSEAGAGDAHGLFGGIGQRPGVPEPEKDLAADFAVEKKMAAAAAAAAMKDRGESSSSSPPAPHRLLWPNQHPTKREPAIRRDRTILRFRKRPHQPLATVVVLRLGLVRAPSEWERRRCVDYGCALLAFCAADEQALDTDTGWRRGYWGVLFKGAGGCCWGGEFG